MSEKTETKPVKQAKAEVELVQTLPASTIDFGNDVYELNGDDVGYTDKYEKLMYFDNNEKEFVVADQQSEDFKEVWRGKQFKAIVLYNHGVTRLCQGAIDGKNREQWTADDKKPVASTFDRIHKSRGSFDPRFSDWLQDEDKKKRLINKAYFFFMIPDIFGTEIIPASLGGSTWKSWANVSKLLTVKKYPFQSVYMNVSLVNDKQKETNQPYKRPHFEVAIDEKGVQWSFKSKENWETKLKPLIRSLEQDHKNKIRQVESMIMDSDAIEVKSMIALEETDGMPY